MRGFTSRRRVTSAKDTMNRLYVVENHFTPDRRDGRSSFAFVQRARFQLFAYLLAGKIAAGTNDSGLGSFIANVPAPTGAMAFDEKWLTEAANDLMAKPGASLVLAGPHQPVVVQLLAYAMNSALKNFGTHLGFPRRSAQSAHQSILQLAAEIIDGRIEHLFIFGGDPVYNAYRASGSGSIETRRPIDWIDLQKKVPEVVRLGYHEDATSALSHWHVPAAHYLESWGDALADRRQLLVDSTDDSAAFRRSVRDRIAQRAARRTETGRTRAGAGNFRATNPPRRFSNRVVEISSRWFCAACECCRSARFRFNASAAGTVAQQFWNLTCRRRRPRVSRDRSGRAAMPWTMAATPTMAGSRKCPIR